MTKLRIATDFCIPTDAVTQTFSILAKRGVGKTYCALVMVEEMLKAHLPVVVADPVGVCWGLRASADGKGPGLPIVVMGGDHGDISLESTAGKVAAEFVVESQQSTVLDLSLLRKAEEVRFMTDFAETLYHSNRQPLHLVLDEADAFAPQRPMHGQERMLGAVEDLVRRGRARGIGVTLITQRAAVLNKDVLTQVEVLVALRTIAPQDRDAIDAWIKVHGTPAQRDELIGSLPSLPIGTAWFWSPGWLDVFQRVNIRQRETFDSSATPKRGQQAATPKKLARVDLEALKDRMAATIERAKADDPKELRKRIAELERQLKDKPDAKPVVQRIEVPVLKNGQLDKALVLVDRLEGMVATVGEIAAPLREAIGRAGNPTTARAPVLPAPRQNASRAAKTPVSAEGLTGPEQKILDGLAWLEAAGITVAKRVQAAFAAGYSPSGGAFGNPLSALRTRGLVDYPRSAEVALTDSGRAIAGPVTSPITTGELHRMILARLDGPKQRILIPLLAAYPGDMSRDELAAAAGYSPEGGAFCNPLGSLRSLGLIDYPSRSWVVALPVLFLD